MAKGTRVFAISLLGFLALCLLFVFSGISYLRSSAGSAWLLSKAQEILATRFQTRVEFDRGSVDFPSNAHFENLRISRSDGKNRFTARIGVIDLRMGLSLLRRKLDITRLNIDHAQVEAQMSSKEYGFDAKSSLSGLTGQAFLEWNESGFKSSGSISTRGAAPVDFIQIGDSGKKMEFHSTATLSSKWELGLLPRPDGLSYELAPNTKVAADFALGTTNFEKASSQEHFSLSATSQHLRVEAHAGTPEAELNVTYAAEKLNAPAHLLHPAPVSLELHAKFDAQFKNLNAKIQAEIDQLDLGSAELRARADEKPSPVFFEAKAEVHADPRFWRTLKALTRIPPPARKSGKPGKYELGSTVEGKILGEFPSLLSLIPAQMKLEGNGELFFQNKKLTRFESTLGWNSEDRTNEFRSQGQTRITHLDPSIPVDLPVSIEHDFTLGPKELQGLLKVEIPGLKAPGLPKFESLRLSAEGSLQERDRFTFNLRQADLHHSLLSGTLEASGSLKKGDLLSHGNFALQFPNDFPEIAQQTLRGRIEAPWTLAVTGDAEAASRAGRDRTYEMDFKTDLVLKNFSWAWKKLRLNGISGRLPISERLISKVNDKGTRDLSFSHLISRNPFERVDYEKIRPLIRSGRNGSGDQGMNPIRINEIHWEDKGYGPFFGSFSLRQNMILAQQFDLSVGQGQIYGELFFDAHPSNLQFGILSRVTGLNLSSVLPARYVASVNDSDNRVSARSGLVVSLNKATVDGRVDITEIGGNQLISLINLLDPEYENERINQARSALGLGYPTLVGLSFAKGYMDMGVDVRVLGIDQHQDLRGIPISTWVSSATADLVKKTREDSRK